MTSQLRGLIYYRALDEFRRIYRPGGPILDKIKFACYVVLIPALLVVMSEVSSAILVTVRTPVRTEESSAFATFSVVMLLSSILFLTSTISELLREMSFTKDQALLRVGPVPDAKLIRYRLTFALIRNLPFALALLWLPIRLISSLVASGPVRIALIASIIIGFAWLGLLALCTASVMVWATNRCNISRHAVFAVFFISSLLLGCLTLIVLMQPEEWIAIVHRFRLPVLTISSTSALLGFFGMSGYFLYLATLQMWPLAARPADSLRRTSRPYPRRKHLFSGNPTWAVFQKDMKDLVRNPVYRGILPGCALILAVGLLAQWKTSNAAPSWRRMMLSLTLIYMVPLFLSARTASLEFRMLGFYRLVMADLKRLLDAKWRAQSVVNCTIVAALALPFFLLVDRGPQSFEPAYFAAIVVVYVPLLTMLAIALGTLFLHVSEAPSLFGLSTWGFVLYLMLAMPLYSFLLNHMYLGSMLYSLFLFPVTIVLFFQARRQLERL